MVYDEQPENFSSRFEVVGCFFDFNGEFLILQREDNKPQGGTWGLPSGKIEINESLEDAIIREIKEETGLVINNICDLNYFKKFYVRYSEYDFIYHIFSLKIKEKPDIVLEVGGHKNFKWVKPQDTLISDNLIQDFDECIKSFYGIK